MYIKAAHDKGFSGAIAGAVVVDLVVILTPHSSERNIGYDGLWEEHVGSVVCT